MTAPAPTKRRNVRSRKTEKEVTRKPTAAPDAAQPAGAAKAGKAKAGKTSQEKYVKGSYRIPKADYALFAVLKERAAATGSKPRKNDLIRAGLQALMDSGRVELRRALDRLPPGR